MKIPQKEKRNYVPLEWKTLPLSETEKRFFLALVNSEMSWKWSEEFSHRHSAERYALSESQLDLGRKIRISGQYALKMMRKFQRLNMVQIARSKPNAYCLIPYLYWNWNQEWYEMRLIAEENKHEMAHGNYWKSFFETI